MRTDRLRLFPVCLVVITACSDSPDEVASNAPSAKELPPPKSSPSWPGAGDAGTPSPDAATSPPPATPEPTRVLAPNLEISELAIFQGVKVPIAKDGAEVDPSDTVHVIAGREGILRVYVEPGAAWSTREVTAELTLNRPGASPQVFEQDETIGEDSVESDLGSTINIAIPAGAIEPDSTYHVRLLTAQGAPEGSTSGARFPPNGDAPLRAWDTGPVLKVKLVPIEVNGYEIDQSEEQLERYRNELYATFPVRKVELTVRETYHYPGYLGAGGSGISALLGSITDLRDDDGAPGDVYYYGAFRATKTYGDYCYGGCTTGLCHLVESSDDAYFRACVGVGFSGESAAGTMAHELGHAHGLPHAPCGGVAGPDSNYPYAGARIGSWGWDLRVNELVEPTDTRDFMSYCSPSWISDYNFDRITHRMHAIAENGAMQAESTQTIWRSAEVDADGSVSWRRTLTLRHPARGRARAIVFERAGADVRKDVGRFYPYADFSGGTLLIPERGDDWDAVRISDLAPRRVVRLVR